VYSKQYCSQRFRSSLEIGMVKTQEDRCLSYVGLLATGKDHKKSWIYRVLVHFTGKLKMHAMLRML